MHTYKKNSKKHFQGVLPVVFTGIVVILLFVFLYIYFGKINKEKSPSFSDGTVGSFALSLSEKYCFDFYSYAFPEEITPDSPLTNECLCFIVNSAVNLSKELSERFLPVDCEILTGKDTILYSDWYGNFELTDKDSYDYKIYSKQMEKISTLCTTSLKYSDGKSVTFFRFDSDCFVLGDLFDDFSELSPWAVESVSKSLEYGLCPYFFSSDTFYLKLRPLENVTEENLSHVLEILAGNSSPDFADSLKIKNTFENSSGVTISDTNYISFSHTPALFFGKMLSSFFSSSDDSVLLSLDADETSFALLFTCEYIGMLYLPLDFCIYSPVSLIFAPVDLSSPKNKLVKIASLLPSSMRDDFTGLSENIILNSGASGGFYVSGVSFEFIKRDEYSVLYIGTNCYFED